MSPALVLIGRAILILGGLLVASFAVFVVGRDSAYHYQDGGYGTAALSAAIAAISSLIAIAMVILGFTA